MYIYLATASGTRVNCWSAHLAAQRAKEKELDCCYIDVFRDVFIITVSILRVYYILPINPLLPLLVCCVVPAVVVLYLIVYYSCSAIL